MLPSSHPLEPLFPLHRVCVLEESSTTSEVSSNQHCKADSRLLAMTGYECVNDSTG